MWGIRPSVLAKTAWLLACVCYTPSGHPQHSLLHTAHRSAAAFVQSKGVFDDAAGMVSAANGIVDATPGILKDTGVFQEETSPIDHVQASLATRSAQAQQPVVLASASPLASPRAASSPPRLPAAPTHFAAGPLVEAAPPSVDTEESPPAENESSAAGSADDSNDLLATSQDIVPDDVGQKEAVTFAGELDLGLRPIDSKAPAGEKRKLLHTSFPTNAPGHHGSVKASTSAKRVVPRTSPTMPRAMPMMARERASAPQASQYQQPVQPWRAADWGVDPSALRARGAAMLASRQKVVPEGYPDRSVGYDPPFAFRSSRPDDIRYGQPSAYITKLDADLAKAKAPLSPSVVSRPKGWDQCLRFTRDIKSRGVRGQELVKTFKNTCMPSVWAGQATQRFELMCNSIGGALQPFTAQIDYTPVDVCDAVLAIFHDVNAVDAKP